MSSSIPEVEAAAHAQLRLQEQIKTGTPEQQKVAQVKQRLDGLVAQRQQFAKTRAQRTARPEDAAAAQKFLDDADAQIDDLLGEYRAALARAAAAEEGGQDLAERIARGGLPASGQAPEERDGVKYRVLADDKDEDDDDQEVFTLQQFGQDCVVINVAHEKLRPIADEPAFRVCGVFAKDGREARAFGRDLYVAQTECDVRLKATHSPLLITNTYDRMNDAKYCEAHLAWLERNAKAREAKKKEEFEANVKDLKIGKTHLDEAREARARQEEEAKAKAARAPDIGDQVAVAEPHQQTDAGEPRSLLSATPAVSAATPDAADEARREAMKALPFPKHMRQPMYNHVVISMELDRDDDFVSKQTGVKRVAQDTRELRVIFFAAFNTVERARRYVKKCASKEFPHLVFDIVDMYEWIFPFSAEREKDKLPEHYARAEQDKLMRGRKVEQRKVELFRDECSDAGSQVPVTTIARDGRSVATDMLGRPLQIEEVKGDNGFTAKKVASTSVQRTEEPTSLLRFAGTDDGAASSADASSQGEASQSPMARGHRWKTERAAQ